MPDAQELWKLIKQAAMEAVAAAGPVTVCRGTVAGTDPLKVKVSSKITLTSRQLLQCKGTGEMAEGDRVLLLREQGGQNYIILGVI